MLQLKNIVKQYRTGDLVQNALNDVSLNLRDNEFISILGPSGSGKTTLLNIIGGLDHYDSGDLIIDGISTKKYKDRAWDSYRNHTIGFVFQSYNLIPHQTVLANVELALTISGIKSKERRQRAIDALKEVGLEEHMHKRPNQLSGGQMQRVAIARALVNDPKILLADEPTGALDTETGIQVMEILKKVADKRLVVMVTHNPELAETYSTRIVKLRDGKIVDDSNPFIVEEKAEETDSKKVVTFGKSKMSFLTSLGLSFNNLRTKKARTIITSVAGSIGIIGIALILALSNSANEYIMKIQRETMESYPITIDAHTYSYEDFIWYDDNNASEAVTVDGKVTPIIEDDSFIDYQPKEIKNNLGRFLKYLNDPDKHIEQYLGSGSIIPVYNTKFLLYTTDPTGKTINTAGNVDADGPETTSYPSEMYALPQGRDSTISKKTRENYQLLYGEWPENADECVIIVDQNGGLSAQKMAQYGFISGKDYEELNENPLLVRTKALSYEDICKKEFTILPNAYKYVKTKNGYEYVPDSDARTAELIKKYGIKMKITGVLSVNENASQSFNYYGYYYGDNPMIGYTYKLTNRIIDDTSQSEIVKAQLSNEKMNVINGLQFDELDSAALAKSIRVLLKNLSQEEKEEYAFLAEQSDFSGGIGNTRKESDTVASFDKWIDLQKDEDIINLAVYYFNIATTMKDTLSQLGYVDYDEPVSLVIYPDTFEGKEGFMKLMDDYNSTGDMTDVISYTDYIKEYTEQISNLINTVSGILIAFVAVSLVVSCIMIGIITHISVLERTKEIGILRALGASKGNISQVFNAETFIIGLLSGLIGVGVAALLCIPAGAIITSMGMLETGTLNVVIPVVPALILIVISTFITMIGGYIPAKSASRKDPVVALRTE